MQKQKLTHNLAILVAALSLSLPAAPRNVILFIGDGMSTPQRMVAEEFARKMGRAGLAANSLKHQATTRTCSANSLVTDSAAAATAIACGEKTNNGSLGVDASGSPVDSCATVAHRSGKKVGIVTTVTINHATPGGFYAHRKSRGDGYGIGLDLLASGFDYFAGGALSQHEDKEHPQYCGDIYERASRVGYRFLRNDRAAFLALKPGSGKVWYVADDVPFAIDADRWQGVPTLAEMTAKGIELLDNPEGFFMMVEGGRIDWAGHANDAATNLREMLALDEAVQVALAFRKRQPDTLVIVTGDHETGGLSMGFAGTGYALYVERLTNQTCSATRISGDLAKLKPASFAAVEPYLSEKFGFRFSGDAKTDPMVLTAAERDELAQAFDHDAKLARAGQKDDSAYDAKKITRLPNVVKSVFSHKCGIGWSSGAHTALPVLTTAEGPGAERFVGFLDNTDISKIIKELVTCATR